MSVIGVSNLTFAYEGSYDTIFENVSFQIDTDWKTGLIGRNGRGKTTFLRLLMGGYEYGGRIAASVCFEYFPYPVHNPSASALEVAEAACPGCQHWELVRELSLLQVAEEALWRPFETLSNGEQTKLLLADLFLKENGFLLIDEPTNHLDQNARRVVSEYLKRKSGFLLISHDRAFLDGCIDHVLSINRMDITVQKGNFSTWQQNKDRQDSYELAQNEKRKKEVEQLSAAAKRTSDWSDQVEKTKYATKNSGLRPDRGYVGHKAAKMMKRSKAIEARRQEAVEEKQKLLKNVESTEFLKLSPLVFEGGRLAELERVSIRYGYQFACENVSFAIEQGDRIALCGRNGSGKSSVLKLLCGESLAYSGELRRGRGLRISYVPQNTDFLQGDLTTYARNCGIDESRFKAILRKLDFSRTQFEKGMEQFSGGQKKKVLIAKSLCEQAHLYLWDEPLNYIDVLSRIQIEELLLEYAPTLLFVEHDSVFCEKIATKRVLLESAE